MQNLILNPCFNAYYFINTNNQRTYLSIKHSKNLVLYREFEERDGRAFEIISNKGDFKIDREISIVFVDSYFNSAKNKEEDGRHIIEISYMYHKRLVFCQQVKENKKKQCVPFYNCDRNDHFMFENKRFRCTKYSDESFGDVDQFYELSTFKTPPIKHVFSKPIICYDVETCKTGKQMRLEPYLLCARFYSNCAHLSYMEDVTFEYNNFTEPNTIGEQFVAWIDKICYAHEIEGHEKSLRVFGFNNFNFDDNFILQAFVTNRWVICQRARNRRISGNFLTKGATVVEFFDLIKWVPDSSLSQACVDYGTTTTKMDINILLYNQLIEENRGLLYELEWQSKEQKIDAYSICNRPNIILRKKLFSQYGIENNTKVKIWDIIKEYCVRDVNSTFDLYMLLSSTIQKVVDFFEEEHNVRMISYDVFDYISPAHFISQIYKQIFNSIDMKQFKMKNLELARFILRAYYGGMVNYGVLGEYRGTIRYMDVTSMYPLAMTSDYPYIEGEEDFNFGFKVNVGHLQTIVDEAHKLREEAKQTRNLHDLSTYLRGICDLKAILLCSYVAPEDKSNLITFSPVAFRNFRKDKIIYEQMSRQNVVLCSSDFKNLIIAGFRIIIHESEFNVHFLKTRPFFDNIMKPLGVMKATAKSDGNNALKKLTKLFMNSISGKMGQNIIHKINVIQSYDDTTIIKNTNLDEVNLASSLHYLACFITAESRHILYFTMYKLQLKYIYNGYSLGMRVGSLLYLDTDSIVFDDALIDKDHADFPISDELGTYNNTKCAYDITWKEKYIGGIDAIIILGRKAYVTMKLSKKPNETPKIINRTLKGFHKSDMEKLCYEDFKKRLLGIKESKTISTLVKKQINQVTTFDSTHHHSYIKEIYEEMVKKTLSKAEYYETIECENQQVYEINKDNIEMLTINNITHFLKFCCSKFM